MNHLESQYWHTKQKEADYAQDTAKVNFLKSLGFRIFPDGNKWCVILGENIQEASFCVFENTPMIAAEKALQAVYNWENK